METRIEKVRRLKKVRSFEYRKKMKCALAGTMCAGIILSNLVTASSAYANEAEKSPSEQKVTEILSEAELVVPEPATDTEGSLDIGEENFVVPEDEFEISDVLTEKMPTIENTVKEPVILIDSSSDGSKETREITSEMWGTSPVSFDETTGVLTISAGTLESSLGASNIGPGSLIKKADVKEIILEAGVFAPDNSRMLFANFTNLVTITGVLDTSNVTDMSRMFYDSSSLTELDVSNWDTTSVTDMSRMFFDCSSLTELDISLWNTTNVTDMSSMFYYCISLAELDVSRWDTTNVTNMNSMFSSSSSLTELDVSNWDTTNVTDMAVMFNYSNSLKKLDVSRWDTSNVVNMRFMFSDTSSLTELDVSNWDTTNVTDMTGTFYNSSNLTELDVSRWDTTNVTDMRFMFQRISLTELDLSGWDTTNVTSMEGMFFNCSNITGLDLSNFDTTNVTSMNGMFFNCSNIAGLDLSNFDTTNVTSMNEMFYSCDKLTKLDLSNFDTTNVTSMNEMFYSCSKLTKLDLSNFDTTNVTSTYNMFDKTTDLESLTLGTKSIFDSSVTLPSISNASGEYTSAWERIIPKAPTQVYASSSDFMKNYDGSMPGTYVWEKAVDLASIEGKDSNIYVNMPWTAEDNFVSATNKDGEAVEFSDITVSGTVDFTTPGSYEITFSYGGQSKTITVTVLADKATLVVKDITIYVGTPWTAADNFISATDMEGNTIDLSLFTVTGTVDIQTPGTYEVVYTYRPATRAEGKALSQTAIITVIEDIPVNPVTTPVDPTLPTLPGSPTIPVKSTETLNHTNELPKAGEKRAEMTFLSLLGTGMILTAACFFGFCKRRKYEKE